MIILEVEQYEIGLGILGNRPKWTIDNPEPKNWTASYSDDMTQSFVTTLE